MSVKTVRRECVSKMLADWYRALVRHELEEAEKQKNEVEQVIMKMEEDQTILLYYSLLELRHNLLTNPGRKKSHYLNKIKPFQEESGPLLAYYYHLFTGMYKAGEGKYSEALEHYLRAEEKLSEIPDKMEKGEFHYRVATVYYHMRQTMLAFKHAKQARAIFDSEPAYGKKSADCDNLLGLCYILNRDFTLAEEHLRSALNKAEKLGDHELKKHVEYNIGFLYSEKNESEKAIAYLEKVRQIGFNNVKTLFLLAREYLKIGMREQAGPMIEQGLQICQEAENEEYFYHYSILKTFYCLEDKDDGQKEAVIQKAVSYFRKNRQEGYANDYLCKLAHYFYEKKDYEKASFYFAAVYGKKVHP